MIKVNCFCVKRFSFIGIETWLLLVLLVSYAFSTERVPFFIAKDIKGNIINSANFRDENILFLFFNPSFIDHKGKIVYARVLYDRWKYSGLKIVAISLSTYAKTSIFAKKSGLTFPVVADPQADLHKIFDLTICCGGTVFALADATIAFKSNRLLETEDLRQLTEKMLFGKVTYGFAGLSWKSPFRLGEKFPDKPFLDIALKKNIKIDPTNPHYLILNFFSTICPICKSGKRIDTLKEIEIVLTKMHVSFEIKLMFVEPMDENDLVGLENVVRMPFSKYIIGDLFMDDDKFITDDSKKVDPLTVLLNEKRVFAFIESVGMTEREIIDRIVYPILQKGKR